MLVGLQPPVPKVMEILRIREMGPSPMVSAKAKRMLGILQSGMREEESI